MFSYQDAAKGAFDFLHICHSEAFAPKNLSVIADKRLTKL